MSEDIKNPLQGATSIDEATQEFTPGDLVELFVVDLTNLGGGLTRWANAAYTANAVTFDGEIFTPISIESDGFEWNGKGTLPRPMIRVFPSAGIKAAMNAYGDFIGGKLTRIKTFSRFLDGQPDADPDQTFEPELYYFEQKSNYNKEMVEWTLSSNLDQEGVVLPKRVFLKDICQLKYRYWNGTALAYTPLADGGCPFNSATYFDVNGTATTIDKDQCGKRLSECKRRFGATAVLPFLGFPGITAYRRR